MKLFLIKKDKKDETYSVVVAAPDEDTARKLCLLTGEIMKETDYLYVNWWREPEIISIKYIGEAADGIEQGIVCKDFSGAYY